MVVFVLFQRNYVKTKESGYPVNYLIENECDKEDCIYYLAGACTALGECVQAKEETSLNYTIDVWDKLDLSFDEEDIQINEAVAGFSR